MTNPLPPEIEARLAEIQAAVDRYGNSCAEWQHQTDTNIKVDDEKKPERIFAECARLIKSLVEDARALGQSSAEVVGARHLAKARAEGRAQGIREAAECAEHCEKHPQAYYTPAAILGVTYVLQSDYDSLLSEINQRGAKARNDGVQAALDVLDEALSGPLAYLDPEDNDGVHSVRGRIYRLLTPEASAPETTP